MTAPLATIRATLVPAAAGQPDPAVTAGREALDAWWWRSYPWYDEAADSVAPIDVSDPWYMKLAFWDWFEWPDWQFSGISPGWLRWPTTLMQWAAWIGIAAVLAVLVYLMIRAYRQRETAGREQNRKRTTGESADDDRRRVEALPAGAPRVPDDLLGEARRRYEQGDYRQAIVYLFSHQLVELDKRHLIRLTKGKTNRQYVGELGRSLPLGGLVHETMRVFEDVFFGNYAIDRARFESCWRRMDEFDTLVAGESARSARVSRPRRRTGGGVGRPAPSGAIHRSSFLFLLLCLVATGCRPDIDRGYGRRQGAGTARSVNGTAVLSKMFAERGHAVFSWGSLSPRLDKRADVIVWFPDDFQPPREDVRAWLEQWLTDRPDRTLIYVGRDYDAAWPYWQKVEPAAPADQADEVRGRKTSARTDFLMKRREIPESEDCEWFTAERKYRPRKIRSLEGEPDWVDGIDPAGLEIELSGRVLPSDYADVVLASEGDMLVSVESWDESQAIVVANGSFLLNLPLVSHEHRKLAARLIDQVGAPKQTVVFLESYAGGPAMRDEDPTAGLPTGLDIFNIWPTNWILLHLAVVGIIFCFSRWPIFGRPADPPSPSPSDFGRHVEALGELLQRSGDAEFANQRLAHCQQTLHTGSPEP